jgi:hypothetical protein
MMTERDDGVAGELVATAPADPIRATLAAAVGAVLDMLPDGYARRVVVEEILETEGRIRARLVRVC